MLKGVDAVLGPELLSALRAMGHGDEIAIVDANFPAASVARKLIRADGVDAPRVARAVIGILPLDDHVETAAYRMAVSNAPDEIPPVVQAFAEILSEAGYERPLTPLERHAFYRRAAEAFVVVATGELRLWGNLILKKGALRSA